MQESEKTPCRIGKFFAEIDGYKDLARAEDDGFPIGTIFTKDILAIFDIEGWRNAPLASK